MTARPRYPRSNCCVPFCRRTSTRFSAEWVCGEHWRLVDRDLKRFRTKRLRTIARLVESYAARAEGFKTAAEQFQDPASIRAYWARRRWRRVERATWARMKRQATERALGISA
jgi:hypothetical protein